MLITIVFIAVTFLFHFCQDVADDSSVKILCDPEELWPGEEVVEVILHLVVFGQAPKIRSLHVNQVVDCC